MVLLLRRLRDAQVNQRALHRAYQRMGLALMQMDKVKRLHSIAATATLIPTPLLRGQTRANSECRASHGPSPLKHRCQIIVRWLYFWSVVLC